MTDGPLFAGPADIAGKRDDATARDQRVQDGGRLVGVAEGERGQDQRPESFGL